MDEFIKLQQDTAHYLTLSAPEKEAFLRNQYEAITEMTPAERQAQVEAIQQRVQQIAMQVDDSRRMIHS